MTNAPSGKRRAVGRSIMPGRPKLPKATRFVSLATLSGNKKGTKAIISDSEIIILMLI